MQKTAWVGRLRMDTGRPNNSAITMVGALSHSPGPCIGFRRRGLGPPGINGGEAIQPWNLPRR